MGAEPGDVQAAYRRLRERTRSAAVHIQNLGKVYDPTGSAQPVVAVDHLNLDVTAGERCALVGPAGAGKSTTLKLIAGLLSPTTGTVTINNLDVERDTEEVQGGIGYLGAPFAIYEDLRVQDYLHYFARAHGLEPDPAAARVESLVALLELESARHRYARELPHATRLLLGLARALVHDPALLLLDEPTLGLDARARALVKRVLGELHGQGKTILLTSPTMTDVEIPCETIRILERGHLLPVDRAEKLVMEAATSGAIP